MALYFANDKKRKWGTFSLLFANFLATYDKGVAKELVVRL